MNKHYEDAKTFINEASDSDVWAAQQQPVVAAMAVAEATLALAYEQRTANLIAFECSQWDAWRRDELTDDGAALWENVAGQVKERLGLA